jgi:serine/threonine protein kinase/formylglycine-generating enzyme required for sulfatase activity
MGEVWEAQDESLQRRVALKFILPERINPKSIELFEREARAGARLSHPNLVRTLAFGRDNHRTWLAQELVEGSRTVKDLLEELRGRSHVPSEHYRVVAVLIAQLADGLQAAHAAGVIHRDIKPQNILIAPDSTPRLADFGLARVSEDLFLSATGEFAGTHFYMSPEQVTAKRIGLDHRTDIFSLGSVLYELLALRRPFEGDTTQQISHKILFFDPPDPSKIRSQCPRNLSVICGKALAKDPDRRYQSMAEFAADLRRHLSDQPILAKPPGTLAKLRLWTRRHPTPSVAIGLGSAAVVVILGLLLEQLRTTSELARLANARDRDNYRLLAQLEQLELEALHTEASELWPAHPEMLPRYASWLQRAEALINGSPTDAADGRPRWPSLEKHKEELKALRLESKPLPEAEIQVNRGAHPRYSELQAKQANLQWLSRMLGHEAWPSEAAVEASMAQERLPEDSDGLNALAWSLVDPKQRVFGQEMRALLIARRALTAKGKSRVFAIRDTLAWALYKVGRFEEALAEGRLALAESGGDFLRPSLASLERSVLSWAEEQRPKREAEREQLVDEVRSLEREILEHRAYKFDDPQRELWHGQLTKLVRQLEQLSDPRTGVMNAYVVPGFGWGVARRYEFAKSIDQHSLNSSESSRVWAEAITAIRNSPKYGGLVIEPQMGLLPIGMDPHSQLWEFAHLQTGTTALRNPDRGLVFTEETGLVFVLIPGMTFWKGAQSEDPNGHNYDAQAEEREGPPHQVELSPYFISKYEMTQGQWLRIAGKNPSYFYPLNVADSLTNPVEGVSWQMCFDLLQDLDLTLPSEAQWECAARGETTTAWWAGQERESLRHRVNLADQTAKKMGAPWPAIADWPDLEDNHLVHCPVGTFPANGFGLHEVAGNLWEWCLDGFDPGFSARDTRKDPVFPWEFSSKRIIRGGSFTHTAKVARSANFTSRTPDNKEYYLGLRPARQLDPAH